MNTSKKLSPATVVLAASVVLALSGPFASAQFTDTHTFASVNKIIPDGNASGLSDSRVISTPIAQISKVRVTLRIQGEFNGDLYGYVRQVRADSTNFCVLFNRTGKNALSPSGYADAGFDVTFDDAAGNGDVHTYRAVLVPAASQPLTGVWQPDGRKTDPFTVSENSPRSTSLNSFAGRPGSGEWTLFLADLESGGTNFVVSWAIELQGIAVPEISWPTPADIVYGTPLSTSELNASSPVAGTFVYNPPAGTVLNAGQGQTLNVTFTPADSATYVAATTSASINVLKKSLTITAVDVVRVYGATETLGASYNGFVNGDTAANLDTPPTITTEASAASPIGSYPILIGGASDANYEISFLPGTLTITRATTRATLSSSANPSPAGQPVTFTAAVTSEAPSTATPVGDVRFSVDGTSSTVPLVNGVATLTTSTLSAGSHVVMAEYLGTANFSRSMARLDPDQTINSQPIAGSDQVPRFVPYGAKVKVAMLLSNDSDPEGDTLIFVGVSANSDNGGSIRREGDWIFYTPPSGFTNDDSFTYTITDGHGQPVVGTVNVRVQSDPLPSPNLVVTLLDDGSYRIRFNGIPGLTYRIESTGSLSPADWQPLATETADSSGLFQVVDTPAVGFGQRFYRSVHP
jgi:subtilisin-like proprotein convertase family protein